MIENSGQLNLLSGNDLLGLTGAMTAVVVVTNGCYHVFRWNPRIVGFLASLVTALLAVSSNAGASWQDWVLTIPNTFIIYFSAIGATGVLSRVNAPADQDLSTHRVEEFAGEAAQFRFFAQWF